MLEDRVWRFDPDIIIATHYHRGRHMTERYLLKLAWGSIPLRHEQLRSLMSEAGLLNLDRGWLPVPYESGRGLAKRLGLEPRMPSSESAARARWIADDVVAWSFRRFADLAASHRVVPIVLGLNAVIDDAPTSVPDGDVLAELRLPLLDLFGIFPAATRAPARRSLGRPPQRGGAPLDRR